jgi:hypothetical protein
VAWLWGSCVVVYGFLVGDLFVWYFPFSVYASQANVPYSEPVFAFLFVSAGLFGMIFSGYVVRACFEK